jgi:hypothetical protein
MTGPTWFDLAIIVGCGGVGWLLFKNSMPKVGSLLMAVGAFALVANLLRLMGYRV